MTTTTELKANEADEGAVQMVAKQIKLHPLWVSVGMFATLFAILVVGTNAGSATASNVVNSRSQAHIPAHTFIDAVPAVPTVLYTEMSQGVASATLLPNWASTLVRLKRVPIGTAPFGGASAVDPYLATSWTRSANGSYTFTLRKGVKSSYGNPLTAADVLYSWQRAVARDATARFLMSVGNIDQKNPVTIINNNTVRINVTAPSPETLGMISGYFFSILDSVEVKQHATTSDPWAANWLATHTATFGPYSVSRFAPGQTIVLKANPYFWAPPYFTTVVIQAVPDGSARLQLMLTGQASHTLGLDWSQFKTAAQQAKKAKLTVQAVQAPQSEILFLNERYAPLKSALVRQAIDLAIDRAPIISSIYLGYAKAQNTEVPSSIKLPQGVKETPVAYNPTRAKQLLAQAGYPNGFPLDIYSTPGQTGDYISNELALLQAQLGQVGIQVQIHVIASAAEFGTGRNNGTYPAFVFTSAGLVADPVYDVALGYSTLSQQPGWVNYSNPELVKLFARLRTTGAGAVSNRLVASILKIVDQDIPFIKFAEVPTQNVTTSSIKGYEASPYPITYYEYLSR